MLKQLTRDEIKKIVYEIASHRFYDDEEFKFITSKASNDGKDLFIYNELGFDSLDIVEFLMELENTIENETKYYSSTNEKFIIEDLLFNSTVTLGNVIDYIYKKVGYEKE